MRWTIRKKYGGVRRVYDTVGASILGPDTEPVEVVPAADLDRLAEALRYYAHGTGSRGSRARAALASLEDNVARAHPVEVVSAPLSEGDVERVAEAWMRALYGAEAFEDIGVEDNDRQVARAALTAYLEDKA